MAADPKDKEASSPNVSDEKQSSESVKAATKKRASKKEKKPAAVEAVPASIPATPVTLETSAPTTTTTGETVVQATRKKGVPLDQKGKIEQINAAAGTFFVDGKQFKLSSKGRVSINGEWKSLEDLRVGDLVAVTYWEISGANCATRVLKGFAKRKKPTTPSADKK